MNKIAAVVVTYNRRQLLLECVAALRAQSRGGLDILVVDNHSSDGTREALAEAAAAGEIRYHDTGENLGGAGGFNRGIRLAAEAGYEYIWVMDDDCIPEETALEALMDADARLGGNYGFLSSKALWKDGTVCRMNVQRRTVTRSVTDFSAPLIPVAMASFVSLFLKSSVVFELGLPIREFFIWTDDWEYTRRISRLYPCYLVSGSVAVHKSGQNFGVRIETEAGDRLERCRLLYRNDVYLYRREGLTGAAYETARLLWHTLRVLTRAEDHRAERWKAIWQGTFAGLGFHPAVEFPARPGETPEHEKNTAGVGCESGRAGC